MLGLQQPTSHKYAAYANRKLRHYINILHILQFSTLWNDCNKFSSFWHANLRSFLRVNFQKCTYYWSLNGKALEVMQLMQIGNWGTTNITQSSQFSTLWNGCNEFKLFVRSCTDYWYWESKLQSLSLYKTNKIMTSG